MEKWQRLTNITQNICYSLLLLRLIIISNNAWVNLIKNNLITRIQQVVSWHSLSSKVVNFDYKIDFLCAQRMWHTSFAFIGLAIYRMAQRDFSRNGLFSARGGLRKASSCACWLQYSTMLCILAETGCRLRLANAFMSSTCCCRRCWTSLEFGGITTISWWH